MKKKTATSTRSGLFEETGLSANMEDYIEAIGQISIDNKVVRVKDIAKKLNIKMPSVTAALNKLKEMKLIEYEKYGYIELTQVGKEISEKVYNRHSCLSDFFQELLHLDPQLADEEACKVEHVLTPPTCENINNLLRFFRTEKNKNSDWIKRLTKVLK